MGQSRQNDDLTAVRAALADRAAEVARYLLGDPNFHLSSKRELRFGNKGSLAVIIAGPKAGLWHDHETGGGGDLLALVMRERRQGFVDAVDFARGFGCGDFVRPTPPPRRVEQQHDDGADDATRLKAAIDIWHAAGSISAPIVVQYFGRRKLIIPDGIDGATLRFHAHCPFGPGMRHPAIVALYQDIVTNEPRAISRTALTAEGTKIDRKMLGPIDGTACKLTPDEAVEHGLHIAEGVETALAGMMLGFAPMWALGSAGAISKFPVLAGIEALTILRDNDPINPRTGKRPGEAAAIECADRWSAAGVEVIHIIPDQVGADIADVVERRAAS